MQEQVFHILNGDALKDQLANQLNENVYIARECLVDGDIHGNNLDEFFQNRALYLHHQYNACTVEEYFAGSVAEFEKIMNIPSGSIVNLWFEDDLFCQVNLWFILNLLKNKPLDSIYLIRPEEHNSKGFGGLHIDQLIALNPLKIQLNELNELAQLWPLYKENDIMGLADLATEFQEKFPFILNAVHAHIERIQSKNDIGRPKKALQKIMSELETTDFGKVFRAFCERESIYGFGDLQVRRLYDELRADYK